MIYPIVLNPNPILLQKTTEVSEAIIGQSAIQELIQDMYETMKNAKGIGLAAPQIGKNLRLTVIDAGDGEQIFINPHVVSRSFSQVNFEEGCLSIPGVYGWVKRPEKVTVKYRDQNGQPQRKKFEGLLARVLQHEIDHLDGILFIDKVAEYTKREQIIPEYPHQ